jgi:sec-independent protein translocase protein TatC
MSRVLRPIGHDERLSIVDHLGELRTRLIVCGIALAIAFGFCFWQNHRLLHVLNSPLPSTATNTSPNHINGLTGDTVNERTALAAAARTAGALAASRTQSAADRTQFNALAREFHEAAQSLPKSAPKKLPITIGVAESFTTTLTVSAYFALLIAFPILIYQGYAFVLPALNPRERSVALPVMLAAPALFISGVAFSYFVILGPAVKFLQNYNSQNFDILVSAKPLYTFEILTTLGIGLAFQLPLGLLGLQAVGAINSRTLTRHWRYAVVAIAVVAAALPGADPVTTALEMLPLLVLYLVSIVLLRFADRRMAARAASELAPIDSNLDPTG